MKSQFDHEKLRAYQDALQFVAWVDPILERLHGKIAARDQLDRASTSVVLNIAEGNGKRRHADRCRYFDIARGSSVECAACLDVLVIKTQLDPSTAEAGKAILLGIVSMVSGLISHFSGEVHEEPAHYGAETGTVARENE